MNAVIVGHSDDLLHVDFDDGRGYEFNVYLDNPHEWLSLSFWDGTEVQVEYDGCWRFSQLEIGEALFVREFEATDVDSDEYSDIVTLHNASDVSDLVHYTARGHVKHTYGEEEILHSRFGTW